VESNAVSYLTPDTIDEFERRLSQRQDALRGYLRAALIEAMRDQTSPFDHGVHDAGEDSFAELTLGVDLAARAREIQELRDIDAALKRIAEDRFGYCVDCGSEIALTRLKIFPTAKRCFVCQQQHERKRSAGADMSPSL
jgi:DnaK suppressor protein